MSAFRNPARPRRGGCAGCLLQSALLLGLGCVLVYGLLVLLAPWNFYFGGHFHPVPGWTGGGWMHSAAAGGDYYLSVSFTPTTPGYRKSPLTGTGYLCTPKGEKFRLRFGGDMPRSHGTDLRGVPIHLYLSNWSLGTQFSGSRDPRLDLYGAFGDSQLTMEDRGSLARAFRPDGTLYGRRNRPWNQPPTRVTLLEDSSWKFTAACPAIPR